MALSVIEQGKNLFYKKKYTEVIDILEPHVLDYRDSFSFYLYLGLSYLYLDEIKAAKDYLQQSYRLKPCDPDLLSAYAVMSLRRSNTAEAVEYYCQALEHNANYKLAKKGLETIRKNNSPEKLGYLIQSGKIKKLYPYPENGKRKGRIIALSLASCTFILILGIIFPYFYKTRNFVSEQRANLVDLELDKNEKKYAVDMEGKYFYVLTQNQILESYEKAKKMFQLHRDNAAQVEINRILSSNASFSIKQKARILMDYFEEPGFNNIKDEFSFSQVRNEPLLYLDCWVVWKGIPVNIVSGNHSTTFSLLVGYDTKRKLEGSVEVFCSFVEKIDIDTPISVLGRIKIKQGVIYLEGKGLYQTQKPAENK